MISWSHGRAGLLVTATTHANSASSTPKLISFNRGLNYNYSSWRSHIYRNHHKHVQRKASENQLETFEDINNPTADVNDNTLIITLMPTLH